MITIKQLTEYIQNALETENRALQEQGLEDVEFKIFTDTGKFVEPYRKVGTNKFIEVINGVFTLGTAQITYLSDGSEFATLPAYLSVIIALDDEEKDGGIYTIEMAEDGSVKKDENGKPITTVNQAYIGNESTIAKLRLVLDNAFTNRQIVTSFVDNDGNEYVTTIIAQVAQGGQRGSVGKIGYSFTFNLNFYFTFVENGINTRQGVFLLDGEKIPYSTSTFSRISNVENNVRSNNTDGAVETIPTFSTFMASFELPALKNSSPTKTLIDYVLALSDYDEAHILTVDLGVGEKSFLMNISESTPSGAGTQNIGLQATFREAYKNYEFLNFPPSYNAYTVELTSVTVELPQNVNYALFDDNGELVTVEYTSETKNIEILPKYILVVNTVIDNDTIMAI
jgi:hypothetical protein